jgi:carbonic anhydrase
MTQRNDLPPKDSMPHATSCGCGACHSPASPAATSIDLSRRGLMRRAMAGAALGLVPVAALQLPLMQTAQAQSTMTPEQALQALSDGNKRFVSGQLASFDEDLTILKEKTVDKQEPFAAILSCADSRVPIELIFDQSIGHVFVVRVAGNIATSEMIASLEYGVGVLGCKAILVLGHSDCGAVIASIAAKEVPGQISALYPYIRPAVDVSGSDVAAVTRTNVGNQVKILSEASPLFADYIAKKNLAIVGGVYDLGSGKVEMVS